MTRRLPLPFAAALLLAVSVHAQIPERPVWPYRHMAVGNLVFLDTWRPAVQMGYLFQPGLHRTRIGTGDFGETVVHPVLWYLHAVGTAGLAFDDDGNAALGAIVQLGALRRLASEWPLSVNQVGLAAQASLRPRGVGSVGRFELLHGNAAVSVGWMWFEEDDVGVAVSVEFLRCILNDLGLVSRCVVF